MDNFSAEDSRAKLIESLDKLENHLLHAPEHQKQIDFAIQERDFHKKLYEDELKQSKLDNRSSLEEIQAENEKLELQYNNLKRLYDAELQNVQKKEDAQKKNLKKLIAEKERREKQQELFQKRYAAIKLKLETEKRKIEADFRQKCDESEQMLQEVQHINNILEREHAELLLQEQQITNNEENLELENTLKSRKLELAELEKQQDETLAELNFLKRKATNVKPNDCCNHSNNDQQCGSHGNPGSSNGNSGSFRNYDNIIKGTTEHNIHSKQQKLGNAGNAQATSTTTQKHFDDEWTEEDYARLEHNLFYTPTVKPSAATYSLHTTTESCNIPQDNQHNHANKWHRKAVENQSEVTSTTGWKHLQPQASTRRIRNANHTKCADQPKSTVTSSKKKRKLMNESMLNASVVNLTDGNVEMDEFSDSQSD